MTRDMKVSKNFLVPTAVAAFFALGAVDVAQGLTLAAPNSQQINVEGDSGTGLPFSSASAVIRYQQVYAVSLRS